MSDEITIEAEKYISSKRAAESSGYTQDYVGQLARKGLIKAKQVGGLWYIGEESLEAHKLQTEKYKPEAPSYENRHHKDLESFVALDGKDYISASRASQISGYNKDYVGQLARNGHVLARQIGNRWYVEKESLLSHKSEKDALLAAVQAESVGLTSHNRNNRGSDAWRQEEGIMTYLPEKENLNPDIRQKNLENQRFTNIHDSDSSSEHVIPIHLVKVSALTGSNAPYTQSAKRNHVRKAPKALLFGLACTIVVLISIGFSSLKSQSVYTVGTSPRAFSLAAASGTITVLGDTFEKWFAPEIVYHRSDQ